MAAETLERNKRVVRRLYEDCINARRLEVLDELIGEEFVGPEGQRGPSGLGQTVTLLRTGFPDIRFTVEDLVAEADRVAVRTTWEGTHTGTFRTFPATQKRVVDRGIAIYQLKDGKVIRSWLQTDRLGFLQQIGIVPANLGTPAQPATPRS